MIFTAGVVGWDEQRELRRQDARRPVRAGAAQHPRDPRRWTAPGPQNIARLTCYVTSIDEYLESAKEIGAAWREIMGKHYPAMALVEVVRLVEREAKVEIEATAVVPE